MDAVNVNNQPATRLWFPAGQEPYSSDFASNEMAYEFSTLWQAIENVGEAIEGENRPNSCKVWIKCGSAIMEENTILMRHRGKIGYPRDHNPLA